MDGWITMNGRDTEERGWSIIKGEQPCQNTIHTTRRSLNRYHPCPFLEEEPLCGVD